MEFHKLEKLIAKGAEIPEFWFKALEENFCQHMEVLFKILTNHSGGKFKDEYNIQRMLNILKYKDWTASHPMRYYLQPLKDSIIALRKELRNMWKKTTTLCKYRKADNEEMLDLTIKMVANDVTC